ncbi:MAG: hypothetical protein KJO64_07325 [Bacteroidia bacterium]|nr:hypothetical protein [Bacteroidia bacterium]
MILKFRQNIATWFLNRKIKKQNRVAKAVGFNDAKKIGILYDATKEDNYQLVKKMVEGIRSEHKEVVAMGFINAKSLPRNRYIKLGLDFFTKKNLNWYKKPVGPTIDNFVKENFDVLINLNIENAYPLRYLAAATKASFKIGRFNNSNSGYCDFMLQVEKKTGLDGLIDQSMHYLKIINSNELQKA